MDFQHFRQTTDRVGPSSGLRHAAHAGARMTDSNPSAIARIAVPLWMFTFVQLPLGGSGAQRLPDDHHSKR
jgi:hypothetical protein